MKTFTSQSKYRRRPVLWPLTAVSLALFSLFAAVLPGSAEDAANATPCPEVAGLDGLLERSQILIFGELHGTDQSPAFIRNVACQLAAAGHQVSLGVELPRDEQPLLDALLAAADNDALDAARQALLASPFWSDDRPDGRSSGAMLQLFEGLRPHAQSGDLRVVAFDIPLGSSRQGREEAMSSFLADTIAQRPDDVHLVLTGNLHSRTLKGAFFPLAGQVKERFPTLVSLDVAHGGGTAWVCLRGPQGCGIQKVGPRGPRETRGIHLLESPDRFGHVGVYDVGSLTASKPASGAEVAGKAHGTR